VRDAIRTRHYRRRTEKVYIHWIKRFIFFHGKRHPADMRLEAHGALLYGGGLRLLECCRLRVKDVDFAANHVAIRDGKDHKDRVTMLPAAVKEPPTSAPSRNCRGIETSARR
jgi:integrase